jgi:hypothetical protein
MASAFDGIDTSDPCAVWPILNNAYLKLLAGESVTRVMFGPQDVMFQRTDMSELRRARDELKAQCEAAQSGKPRVRRRAFSSGFRY